MVKAYTIESLLEIQIAHVYCRLEVPARPTQSKIIYAPPTGPVSLDYQRELKTDYIRKN